MDLADRARRCRDYAEALEEERRKILVFQRELPLCLQLVSEAIESCKQPIGSEDASSDVRPVLEEFIPLKPNMSPSSSEESSRRCDKTTLAPLKEETPDWLRSVQLWNQQPDLIPGPDRPQKPVAVKFGGAFHPFEKEKLVPLQAASSTAVANAAGDGGAGGCSREKQEEQSRPQTQPHRKERRSWSPELHRRFLNALQQLGGSHTATPKQIRELMQVDGLTNDEVKSHLQKYRLHTRRSTPTIESSPQAPQFVVVGSIWVPPLEYAAAAAQPTEGAGNHLGGIYAPVASKLPLEFGSQQQQQSKNLSRSPTGPLHPEGRCIPDNSIFEDDGATNCASPTSSSSQTVTA